MVKKGFHYSVYCDAPECDKAFIIGVAKLNFEAKQKAKQEAIKRGWVPGLVGTIKCDVCHKKQQVEILKEAAV